MDNKLFEIDKGHCIHTEQKLLYNIYEMLSNIHEVLINKNDQPDKCKVCGGVHLNTGERLACAKKNKRKGG